MNVNLFYDIYTLNLYALKIFSEYTHVLNHVEIYIFYFIYLKIKFYKMSKKNIYI